MLITRVRRVVDNRIDIECFELSHNEYGTEHKHWIYSNQCRSKEEAIKSIDDWVKRIQSYANILKLQLKEIEND